MKRASTWHKTVFHFKVRGVPFGLYRWRRNRTEGFVTRIGPCGHVQVQFYRMRILGHGEKRDRRRGKHGVAVHWWPVSGRRRKVGIDVGFIL